MRLLLDRSFDEGGVNYGNRLVLGVALEPIPTPTALMLLAVSLKFDNNLKLGGDNAFTIACNAAGGRSHGGERIAGKFAARACLGAPTRAGPV